MYIRSEEVETRDRFVIDSFAFAQLRSGRPCMEGGRKGIAGNEDDEDDEEKGWNLFGPSISA